MLEHPKHPPGYVSDICLIQHLEEEVSDLRSELRAITNETLAMPKDEPSLADRGSSIQKGLSDQKLMIKWLLHKQASSLKVEKVSIPEEGSVKLYKISTLTFDGDILNCSTFLGAVQGNHR